MSMDEMQLAERLTALESREKSNTHRLDTMEKTVSDLSDLTASVKVLATKQQSIEQDVTEIKTDVKGLTEKPGKRWDTVVMGIVTAIVAGLVGWALARVGIVG